jgi:hypothetical protein
MRAKLPWLPRFLCRSADLAALNASEKQAREARLTGMVLAMHRTQIEKLIAQRIALFLLSEDVLQSECEFAETRRFWPSPFVLVVSGKFEVREEAAAAV